MRAGKSRKASFSPWGPGPCVPRPAKGTAFRSTSVIARQRRRRRRARNAANCPPPEVIDYLRQACHVSPERLTLLAAPTASQAGGVQIVARSIETALHKMHEIGFDLGRVESGFGVAPLPPVATDDLAAIGRTNDAILYGGEVTLWVRGGDDELTTVGPAYPSNSSDGSWPTVPADLRALRSRLLPRRSASVQPCGCDTGESRLGPYASVRHRAAGSDPAVVHYLTRRRAR